MNISEDFTRRVADDRFCAEVRQAVEEGNTAALERLGMRGFGRYAGRLAELIEESVRLGVDPDDLGFETLINELASPARYAHHLVNEAGTAIQSAKDKPLGIHIKPIEPEFDDDALKGTVGNAVSTADTVEALADGLAYAVKKAGNDFIKANAEQRSRAGFEVGVKRSGSSKCCEWCAARIGSWALKNAPDGVFGCHANCSCTVEYTSSTGAKTSARGANLHRYGTGAFVEVGYEPPHVGAVQGAEKVPHRLTRGVNAPALYDGSRFYRNVELGNEKSRVSRGSGGEILINASPVLNSNNRLFISDKLSPKPKLIHQVDNAMTEVLKDMGISDAENPPDVYIISDSEMAKNAVAAYRAGDNKFFVNADFAYYTRDKAPEIMRDFVCPEDYRSTYYHEMFHWLDAQEYREKIGEITKETYSDYDRFVQEKAKKALDKLDKSGYNIFEISEYASESLDKEKYDEAYTEYRTLLKLTR